MISQFVIWGADVYIQYVRPKTAIFSLQALLTESGNHHCNVSYFLHVNLLQFHGRNCLLSMGKWWGYGNTYVAQTLKFDRRFFWAFFFFFLRKGSWVSACRVEKRESEPVKKGRLCSSLQTHMLAS